MKKTHCTVPHHEILEYRIENETLKPSSQRKYNKEIRTALLFSRAVLDSAVDYHLPELSQTNNPVRDLELRHVTFSIHLPYTCSQEATGERVSHKEIAKQKLRFT